MPAITGMVMAGVGLLSAGAGAYMSYNAAGDAAAANAGITQQELLLERQRLKQMELDARRRQLEQIRVGQQQRSMALTTANAQGAIESSALPGAYGQIGNQTGVNLMGITQNLDIGRNMFDINAVIAQYKMQLGQAQTQAALGSGLTSLGGSLMSSGPTFGNLMGNFGNTSYGTQTAYGYGTQMRGLQQQGYATGGLV